MASNKNWSVEDPHGTATAQGLTEEQAFAAARADANRVGVARYAIGPGRSTTAIFLPVAAHPAFVSSRRRDQ